MDKVGKVVTKEWRKANSKSAETGLCINFRKIQVSSICCFNSAQVNLSNSTLFYRKKQVNFLFYSSVVDASMCFNEVFMFRMCLG